MSYRTLLFSLAITALLVASPVIAQEDEEAAPTDDKVLQPVNRIPTLRGRTAPTINKKAPAAAPNPLATTPSKTGAQAGEGGKAAGDAKSGSAAKSDDATKSGDAAKTGTAAKGAASGDGKKGGKEKDAPRAEDVDGAARYAKGKGYFNFDKADLMDVVKQISKLTQMNFIIPERIKTQKVTILCEKPVSTKDAFRAFLAALEVNNLALIPTGKFYKIEQRKESVRQTLPMLMDGEVLPDGEEMITAVFELQHLDVDSVQKVIQNLVGKDATIQTFPPSLLILADSAANIIRLKRLIDKIDVEGVTNQVHIIDIQYAAATDVAQKLQQLFEAAKAGGRSPGAITAKKGQPAGAAADQASGEEELVVLGKAIADERTNKLILVCSRRSFERVKEIVEILDVPVSEGTPQVHVYFLSNAVAEEAAQTLTALAQGSQSAAQKGAKPKGGPATSADLFEGQVKVTADKATNSLVIVATGRDYKRLERVIERLDIRRAQVFVEAVIMEVSLSKQVDLGLNLFTGYKAEVPGLGEGYGLATNPGGQGLISSAGTSAATSAVTGGSSAVSATNLAAFLGFLAFRGPIVPGSESVLPGGLPSFGAVLQAVQKDADVDVLSTPHILTTDNEKAEILVGQNVPFAGSISGGASGSYSFMPMVSVQRQDVALKFAVTPHVSEDRQVRLEIEQEVSDLGEYIDVGYGQKQPVTTKRNAKTTVVVKDQQTIILGGLISNRRDQTETKIPLLGDIPIIGWAFKTHGNNMRKSNLLLVLTPYIIESYEDFRRIYERKLAERREFIDYFYSGADEFKVPVEWAKKTGAYSMLKRQIAREMMRVENGGPGFGNEVLITPPSESTIDISPPVDANGGDSGDQGGGTPQATGEEGKVAPILRHPVAPAGPSPVPTPPPPPPPEEGGPQ